MIYSQNSAILIKVFVKKKQRNISKDKETQCRTISSLFNILCEMQHLIENKLKHLVI